jgi:phthalate 4,5-dioxygenase oxygenase subunit
MLTKEQNELVCRVGRGTPMGELMRQYWLPALLSSELPEPDGTPVRVRLLGEDLVAFRDSQARVGLLQANCPHRGAPLAFARNEENGLRCIYHGWKYDVNGRCSAMPNVPSESDFKDRVRLTAYPCVEQHGLIWTYMGSQSPAPPIPRFDFAERTPQQCYFTRQYYECNWLQVLEGDFDPSHSSFLHASLNPPSATSTAGKQLSLAERENVVRFDDRSPLIMTVNTDYGLLVGARREAGPDYYWRLNLFAMPFYAFVPTSIDSPLHCNAWLPVDDDNTIVLRMDYHLDRSMTEDELGRMRSGMGSTGGPGTYLPPTNEAWGSWMPNLNRANQYGIDREVQKTQKYSGIRGVWAEDKAVTEGMGPIIDRTQEQLGPSDVGIIQIRRMLIEAATALREHGATPPGVTAWPNMVKSCTVFLPKEMAWQEVADALISGRLEKTASG